MPKVSVILTTYNRAVFISRAIKSVLNQTYKDFELIVVDDGSTDNTERVLRRFSDERIYYTKHKVNKGAAAARNTGLKLAKGELIAFQDSDDEWLPHKLQRQIEVFKKLPPRIGVVYSNMKPIAGDGVCTSWEAVRVMPDDGIVYRQFLLNFRGLRLQIGTSMIRGECFENVGGFDERLPRFIDIELFIRISKYYYFYYIDEPLVNCYRTPGSITDSAVGFVKGEELILNKYMKDLSEDSKIFADILYDVGNGLCLLGDVKKGKSYLLKALRLYPWRFKYLAATLASILGKTVFNTAVGLKQRLLGFVTYDQK